MEISISTTLFGTQFPFLKGVELLYEAGYRTIEISRKNPDTGKEKKILNDMGIKVWSIHGTLGNGSASLSEDERKKAVASEYLRMEDTSVFAPCPYVVHYLHRYNNREHGVAFRKSLEELHEKAIELGLNIAVETVPYKPRMNERHPFSVEIAEFVRSFKSPNLSLCIDINHSNINENLEDVARNCKGVISTIHVSDNHGEWEDHLPPGEGIIKLPGVLRELRNCGYSGPCNIECHVESIPPAVEMLSGMREFVAEQIRLSYSEN